MARHKTTLIPVAPGNTAEELNQAVARAPGDLLLFLDTRAKSAPGWQKALESATAPIRVGQTLYRHLGKTNPYGKLAEKLFHGHSQRAAQALGHALPWGPIHNLAIEKEWFEKVGPFSTAARNAFDIDWCWRALLQGARLEYIPQAKTTLQREYNREAILELFDHFGRGEAWLHREYSFLEEGERESILLTTANAFQRLRHHSQAASIKSLAPALEDAALAFASGLRTGLEQSHRPCAFSRTAPQKAIGWPVGKKEWSLFVPGKGLTNLTGKPLEIWLAWEAGASSQELDKLFQKFFKATAEEAMHAREDFQRSLSPA